MKKTIEDLLVQAGDIRRKLEELPPLTRPDYFSIVVAGVAEPDDILAAFNRTNLKTHIDTSLCLVVEVNKTPC